MANMASSANDDANKVQQQGTRLGPQAGPDGQALARRIEGRLRAQIRFDGAVAIGEDGAVYLSGRVPSPHDHQQAQVVARELSGGAPIVDDLFVERVLPDDRAAYAVEDLVEEPEAETVTGTLGPQAALNPEFTGQPLETDDLNVVDSGAYDDEPDAEPDPTYFAPTDPVTTSGPEGELEVLGGFDATSMNGEDVAPSVEDNRPGDEALVEAVTRELREDATTTDLRIDVFVQSGIARLRGRVVDLEDAENAEEVAGRVPGIREVSDELDVEQMDQ
jgi:osmotically-inducible protein OsmY